MKVAFLGYLERNWDATSKREQDSMLEDCFSYDKEQIKQTEPGVRIA